MPWPRKPQMGDRAAMAENTVTSTSSNLQSRWNIMKCPHGEGSNAEKERREEGGINVKCHAMGEKAADGG